MDLLKRFAAGDLDAFESLFRQHQAAVYRWIARIVRDPATPEDLTVETFWRAYKARARFRPDGNFEAWLHRIATNASLDHLRTVQKETSIAVHRALASLPARLRIVAQLGLIQEEPYRSIAEALGISESAAK